MRAIRLLNLIASEKREMSLTEISKRLDWPKSTVHGLLSTLRDFQFVDQSPVTGHYNLGIRLFELGSQVAGTWDVRTLALPSMQALNDRLGEMVQLATEDNGEVLYLEKIDSTHMMRIVSEVGSRLPMHCSGLGKVLLAHKKPSEVKWILQQHGMRAMTQRTITDPKQLDLELEKVRRQGFAVDDREIMDGLRCVAAPIYDREGRVRYAISISGFANNMQGTKLDQALEYLKKAAADISYEMGYRPESDTGRSL